MAGSVCQQFQFVDIGQEPAHLWRLFRELPDQIRGSLPAHRITAEDTCKGVFPAGHCVTSGAGEPVQNQLPLNFKAGFRPGKAATALPVLACACTGNDIS